MVGSGLAPRGCTHRIPAALHAKPAKPSQAKPIQAKPSQAKPSALECATRMACRNCHTERPGYILQRATCNVHPASVKTCLQPIDEVRVCFVQRACACRIMVGTRRPSTCPHLPPRASACPRPAGRVPMRVLTTHRAAATIMLGSPRQLAQHAERRGPIATEARGALGR